MARGSSRTGVALVVVIAALFSLALPASAVEPSATGATSPPVPAAAIELAVDHPDGVIAGENAAYTITVRNSGTVPLFDVVVTDTFLGTVGSTPALEPGEGASFHASRVLSLPTTGTCTATARTASQESVSVTVVHFVDVATVCSFPDYALDKYAMRSQAAPGDVVTFRVVYRNLDEQPPGVADVTIVDTFDPRWMEVVDAAGGDISAGSITWHPSSLAPSDGPRTIEYRLRIKPGAPVGSRLVNTAVVSAESDDSGETAANNTGQASVLVVADSAVPAAGGDEEIGGGAASGGAASSATTAGGTGREPFLPFTGPSPLTSVAGVLCALLGLMLRRAAALG